MSNYSREEIAGFEAKDLRISKIAILKSLIESGGNGNAEVEENCKIVDKYVSYIYGVKPVVCSDKAVAGVDWKAEAEAKEVPIPTPENIKILNLIRDEYKKVNGGAEILPGELLNKIWLARGKYPTKKSSVSLVLKLI